MGKIWVEDVHWGTSTQAFKWALGSCLHRLHFQQAAFCRLCRHVAWGPSPAGGRTPWRSSRGRSTVPITVLKPPGRRLPPGRAQRTRRMPRTRRRGRITGSWTCPAEKKTWKSRRLPCHHRYILHLQEVHSKSTYHVDFSFKSPVSSKARTLASSPAGLPRWAVTSWKCGAPCTRSRWWERGRDSSTPHPARGEPWSLRWNPSDCSPPNDSSICRLQMEASKMIDVDPEYEYISLHMVLGNCAHFH